MSLQRIKKEVFLEMEALFALAATDELAGDFERYKKKLDTIGQICNLLGVATEVTTTTINLLSDTAENNAE